MRLEEPLDHCVKLICSHSSSETRTHQLRQWPSGGLARVDIKVQELELKSESTGDRTHLFKNASYMDVSICSWDRLIEISPRILQGPVPSLQTVTTFVVSPNLSPDKGNLANSKPKKGNPKPSISCWPFQVPRVHEALNIISCTFPDKGMMFTLISQ